MADLDKIISLEKLSRYHTNVNDLIDSKVNKLITDTELRFFCVEPVTVVVNGENKIYQANTLVDMFLNSTDEFEVIPTSNTSILSLYAWPGALNTFYDWLNGVNLFDGVLFDMNDEAMYTHTLSIDTIVTYAKAGKSILINSSSDTNANNSQLIEYNYTLTDDGELNTMALRWYQYEYLCYMYIVLGSSGSYTVTLTKKSVD